MADLSYSYIRKRAEFGKQPMFCEQGPEFCDHIMPDFTEHKRYILRNPIHRESQNACWFAEHSANTERANITNSGVNHSEGGWPYEINCFDPESTQRYRRRVEKEDAYIHCVNNCAQDVEYYVLQNNAIDMYSAYFLNFPSVPPCETSSIRSLNIYRETSNIPRQINSIDWQSEGGQRFAVTYVNVDFDRKPKAPIEANIWNIDNATTPETTIFPPSALLDLKYSPRDTNILAGGLMTGQVAVWDLRDSNQPAGISPPHISHRDHVRNVLFINTKAGGEFFSGAADGVCKWWDMRNMNKMTDEMIVDLVKTNFETPTVTNALGITALEYEPTIPSRFMVGTENGMVVGGNRKGKTPLDKFNQQFECHLGPVNALERNPGFMKNFLTVGDWTWRIWSEDCRESNIISSPPQRYRCSDATWSPLRHSLICLVQTNGFLSCWDILRSHLEPIISVKVCKEALLKVAVHENGAVVACGSEKGNVYLQELSANLVSSNKNDKSLIQSLFERETKRERILEAKMREIKLKQRQAEEGSHHSVGEPDPTIGNKDLTEAQTDFFSTVKKEMTMMT